MAAGVPFIIHYSCLGDEEEESDGLGEEWIGTRWILKLKCKLDCCSNHFSALYESEQGGFTHVPMSATATDPALMTCECKSG